MLTDQIEIGQRKADCRELRAAANPNSEKRRATGHDRRFAVLAETVLGIGTESR